MSDLERRILEFAESRGPDAAGVDRPELNAADEIQWERTARRLFTERLFTGSVVSFRFGGTPEFGQEFGNTRLHIASLTDAGRARLAQLRKQE
jgi:hypothetical protein